MPKTVWLCYYFVSQRYQLYIDLIQLISPNSFSMTVSIKRLMGKFDTVFQNKDPATMIGGYDDDTMFCDPAFGS